MTGLLACNDSCEATCHGYILLTILLFCMYVWKLIMDSVNTLAGELFEERSGPPKKAKSGTADHRPTVLARCCRLCPMSLALLQVNLNVLL